MVLVLQLESLHARLTQVGWSELFLVIGSVLGVVVFILFFLFDDLGFYWWW